MVSEQKIKIRNLKKQIQSEQDVLVEAIKTSTSQAAPTEDNKEEKPDLNALISLHKGKVADLRKQLKEAKQNRTGSSFFEFTPSPPNRRIMRLARKLKKI